MRNVLALALVVSACTHDEHYIEASWTIERLAGEAEATSIACPQGWSTARLVAVDPAYPDARHVDSFPCGDRAGTSTYLSSQAYVAWIEIVDGDKLLASSLEQTVPVTSFEPILIAEIVVDAGYVEADWATPCTSAVDQLDVRLDVGLTSTFVSCSAGHAISPALAPGTYSVTLTSPLGTERFDGVAVTAPNHVTRVR